MISSTMAFKNLPNEILLRIISVVAVDDLVNFVTVNRLIYTLAHARLEHHRANMRKYSSISLDAQRQQSPILLLLEILQDRTVAPYVKQITFLPFEPDYEVYLDDSVLNTNFGDLFKSSPWLPEERRLAMETAIREGNQGAAFALLLGLLPNLKSLSWMSFLYEYQDWLKELLLEASRVEDDSRSSVRPLSKLSSLYVEHWDTEGGEPVENILQFIYLPSLRILSGAKLSGYEFNGEGNHSPLPMEKFDSSKKSFVTSVRLDHSAISAAALAQLIEPMQNLNFLQYEHAGPIVDGPADLDFEEYADDFINLANSSLEARELEVELEESRDVLRLVKVTSTPVAEGS